MVIETDRSVESSDLGYLVPLVLVGKGAYLIFIHHSLVHHFLL